MTPCSTQLAVLASMLTQPFTSDQERYAARAKLQFIASEVQAMELALAEVHARSMEKAAIAEVRGSGQVVSLRPALTLVPGDRA
jgi:hypothetical protein